MPCGCCSSHASAGAGARELRRRRRKHGAASGPDRKVQSRAQVRVLDDQAVAVDPQSGVERHALAQLNDVLRIDAYLSAAVGARELDDLIGDVYVRQLEHMRQLPVTIVVVEEILIGPQVDRVHAELEGVAPALE